MSVSVCECVVSVFGVSVCVFRLTFKFKLGNLEELTGR